MGETKIGWPDLYRPEDLEAMALAPEQRKLFERYLAGDALPRSLILFGPPGFGKTTVATIIAKKLYSQLNVMRVPAAQTGNVEYIRTTVIDFMRGMSFDGGTKLLIFEEASALSPEAQVALRVPMENWFDLVRIIFNTNDLSKLDPAIRSRCDPIEMLRPPVKECARILGQVLEAEKVVIDPRTVFEFTSSYFAGGGEDMRGFLAHAQHCVETQDTLPVPREAERSTAHMLAVWEGEYRAEDVPDGGQLLNALAAQFSKYISLPPCGAEALALWTVFAWAHEAFSISPILALVSPTPRAGKSTVFDMLEQLLMPRLTFHPSSMTPAVLFRLKGLATADEGFPAADPRPPSLCLLIDEADRLKLKADILQAVLNSGHARRTAIVLRMMGGEVGKFSSWYPKALALIDRPSSPLPDTLRDRSIIVPMQRKTKDEVRPKFPRQQPVPELAVLWKVVALWVWDRFTELRELGAGANLAAESLNDRARDNWHPLMCIARVAGSDWEERARRASLVFSDTTRDPELLVELLAGIRDVFDAEGVDGLPSVALVEKLVALEASPWKEQRLGARRLSDILRPLGIRPKPLWIGPGPGEKENKNGYKRAWFEDAFARYL